jgi:hypothetical protein
MFGWITAAADAVTNKLYGNPTPVIGINGGLEYPTTPPAVAKAGDATPAAPASSPAPSSTADKGFWETYFPFSSDLVATAQGYYAAATARRGPNGGVVLDHDDLSYPTDKPTDHPYQSTDPGADDRFFGSQDDPNAAAEDSFGFLPGTGPTFGILRGGSSAVGFGASGRVVSFWQRYKTPLMIGAAGVGVYLLVKHAGKKS